MSKPAPWIASETALEMGPPKRGRIRPETEARLSGQLPRLRMLKRLATLQGGLVAFSKVYAEKGLHGLIIPAY